MQTANQLRNHQVINVLHEKPAFEISGWLGLVICLGLGFVGYLSLLRLTVSAGAGEGFLSLLLMGLAAVATSGFVIVQPQEARVIQFFGHYVGTVRTSGLRWTIPLTTKQGISLRLRNLESPRLKVNEADGNPIEIAAIIVWRVVDTALATFNVEFLEKFVEKQTESAIRALAMRYPYDRHKDIGGASAEISLHESIDEINEQLRKQVSEGLVTAGIEILEARISHLAYAPEIAAAMLQRQQAQAIIAARQKIVDGAVGMVDMALKQLLSQGIVELDEERKAAMVSNLLVVLCSERPSQPVLNTGSIY
ncbi:MAG: hypothetical protein C5B49_02300 [Bdellovibrio sp.]|nr:MAG: hypothetical protein C5B49_02300 [Bdellovibrio sp.]